jgi:integrase
MSAGSTDMQQEQQVKQFWKQVLWRQFGAALDMLKDAVEICPDGLWTDESRTPIPWRLVHHTLFWTDLYLHGAIEGFRPPEPIALEELDPRGIYPERPFSREQLLSYLTYIREKCRKTVASVTAQRAEELCRFGWGEVTFFELQIYNLRHVQHGAAQLNLVLRQRINSAGGWVGVTPELLSDKTERDQA